MPSNFDDISAPSPQHELVKSPMVSEIAVPPQDRDHGHASSAVQEVKTHFATHDLFVGADQDIRILDMAAVSAREIADVAVTNAPTSDQIIDELTLAGSLHKTSILRAALRKVLLDDGKARQKQLISGFTSPLPSEVGHAEALSHMHRFAASTFECAPELSVAVMLHFIYQVKRKLAKLPVCDHLMPVFVSAQQGVGKTRAVKRFLAPLAEMAKSVLISDIADPRSIYVFRHPVLMLDDMEKLGPNEIPIVKNRVTGDEVIARGMHSNREMGTRQMATFIGTANESVMSLVPDQTGHRRFFELIFRNANPATGGDPSIWQVINDTDFMSIWRSVDPFAPSPLEAVRSKVFGTGGPPRPKSKVHAWALTLDIDGETLGRIAERTAGVPSLKLYDLYCEDTKDAWMSVKEFGKLMRESTKDHNVQFGWAKRYAGGMYFPLRRL